MSSSCSASIDQSLQQSVNDFSDEDSLDALLQTALMEDATPSNIWRARPHIYSYDDLPSTSLIHQSSLDPVFPSASFFTTENEIHTSDYERCYRERRAVDETYELRANADERFESSSLLSSINNLEVHPDVNYRIPRMNMNHEFTVTYPLNDTHGDEYNETLRSTLDDTDLDNHFNTRTNQMCATWTNNDVLTTQEEQMEHEVRLNEAITHNSCETILPIPVMNHSKPLTLNYKYYHRQTSVSSSSVASEPVRPTERMNAVDVSLHPLSHEYDFTTQSFQRRNNSWRFDEWEGEANKKKRSRKSSTSSTPLVAAFNYSHADGHSPTKPVLTASSNHDRMQYNYRNTLHNSYQNFNSNIESFIHPTYNSSVADARSNTVDTHENRILSTDLTSLWSNHTNPENRQRMYDTTAEYYKDIQKNQNDESPIDSGFAHENDSNSRRRSSSSSSSYDIGIKSSEGSKQNLSEISVLSLHNSNLSSTALLHENPYELHPNERGDESMTSKTLSIVERYPARYNGITERDILFGKGCYSGSHNGNIAYRSMIKDYQEIYKVLKTKREKTEMARTIVARILENGGRFMIQVQSLEWVALSPEASRKKVSQALREKRR